MHAAGAYARAFALAIQSDGKIPISGDASDAEDFRGYIVRIKPDGSLDSTFDQDGILQPIANRFDRVEAVAQQGDKIVYATLDAVGRSTASFSSIIGRRSQRLNTAPQSIFTSLISMTSRWSTSSAPATHRPA